MRVLVFGKSGQLARALQDQVPPGVDLAALDRRAADLSDPARCAAIVAGAEVDVVINAAAYTDVDGAEAEEALAQVINADAPAAMAAAAAARGIPFLHVSTDYVFDGSAKGPIAPDAATAPLGAYGRTKLAGELGVRAAGGPHVILRTAWVFSAAGKNFVTTMLRAAAGRDEVSVISDQTGGPTAAADLASSLFRMAQAFQNGRGKSGTYHFCGEPAVSRADFARVIFRMAGRDVKVRDIATRDWPAAAPRPANSYLDCRTLQEAFGILQPGWQAGLRKALENMEELA